MKRLEFPKVGHKSTGSTGSRAHRRGRRSSPVIEALEGRLMLTSGPTIYTVTSTSGGFAGSAAGDTGTLPFVVSLANENASANPDGSLIEFSPAAFPTGGNTILLTSPLVLGETVGPEVISTVGLLPDTSVAISGSSMVNALYVEPGVTATLDGLIVAFGVGAVGTDGGAIDNAGSLTLSDCTIASSTASASGGDIFSTGPLLSISDSTIDGGSAAGVGGDIYNTGASLTITDSTIEGGSASSDGGDIYNTGASLTITGSTIESGSISAAASATDGGGDIYNTGASLSITDSTIEGGYVTNVGSGDGVGGDIYSDGTTLSISGSTITTGYAADLGGDLYSSDSSASITSTVFKTGTAGESGGDIYSTGSALSVTGTSTIGTGGAGLDGGGIYNTGGLTVTGAMITSNTAGSAGHGGGIYNAGTANLLQDYFVGNTANIGGAIMDTAVGKLTSAEDTYVKNTADSDGGAIASNGTLTTVNDTIASNTVDSGGSGGGIAVGAKGTVTLYNTIVADNAVDTAGDEIANDIYGSVSSSSGYNLIGDGGSGGLVNGSDGNQVVMSDSDVALSIGDFGGPTPSVALAPDNPAIDAGSLALAVDPATGSVPANDQRGAGFPRIADGTVDIGSYEYMPVAADLHLVVTATASSVMTNTAFGVTVTAETEVDSVASSYSGTVTLALTIPGGATLGGTLMASLVDGVATFSGLTVNDAGDYTITATSSGVASATTSPIVVSAPPVPPTPVPVPVSPMIIGANVLVVGTNKHRRVEGITLRFNEALDPASGSDPGNYVVKQKVKHGRKTTMQPVAVDVDYNPVSNSTTLIFVRKAVFTLGGQLEVIGASPGGIVSTEGAALDAMDGGAAGSDVYLEILPAVRGIRS